jgi:putative PIN family toxin of toxin-antitoxin system
MATPSPAQPLRLVLDTNVVIAALLWNGPPRQLLQAAIDGQIELATSQPLLVELTHSLGYAKFAKRVAAFNTSVAQLVQQYAAIASSTPAAVIAPAVPGDPDDDAVLACALAAQADLVVSGDAHLLNLKHFHQMLIVTPRAAFERVTSA